MDKIAHKFAHSMLKKYAAKATSIKVLAYFFMLFAPVSTLWEYKHGNLGLLRPAFHWVLTGHNFMLCTLLLILFIILILLFMTFLYYLFSSSSPKVPDRKRKK